MDPMEADIQPLTPTASFCFHCSPDVACFNACCRDLNQFLTGYDILRLARRLGLSTTAFLRRYTRVHTGPETGLPVAAFRTTAENGHACPFVTASGCGVYTDRPASCRTYPLVRALTRSRLDGRLTEHFALLREPHCRGFETEQRHTPQTWLADQGAAAYNRVNDRLLPVIAMKNRLRPGPLAEAEAAAFRLAVYDLDAFRERIGTPGFPESLPVAAGRPQEAAQVDLYLIELALDWTVERLFGHHR